MVYSSNSLLLGSHRILGHCILPWLFASEWRVSIDAVENSHGLLHLFFQELGHVEFLPVILK